MTSAYDFVGKHFDTFTNQLADWLRIPSISADPAFKEEVLRAADWLAADMRRIGLDNVAVMPTGGHPVVYGEWLKAGADKPTVLVYGHYDVQPAVIEDGWKHDPFTPDLREGRIWARGACDDKGQVMTQLKAAEALLATGGSPVNLKYIIEGEEESSSIHLAAFVAEHTELLKADLCLISDTSIMALDQPSINYSLRGIASMEVIVSGPRRDLHSGNGGILHNPAQAIAEIVAKLHNPDGSVAVPGFYDDVYTATAQERELLKKADMHPRDWENMMGDMPEWGEAGYLKIERIGIRPTLEINGIYGGYAGDGFKTVIPAKAIAKISCRLVAHQDPDKIGKLVADYIQQLTPPTVRVEVRQLGAGKAARTPIEHPAVQAAVRAYQRNWAKEVLFVPGGGSIPVVADFQSILGLPVVLMGFSLPDGGAHGPNESFHLDMFRKGIATLIAFMQEYAHVSA
jgi:acetylornithine deacetylase/succinyl-diaminopimelate desuccinylase-like protein